MLSFKKFIIEQLILVEDRISFIKNQFKNVSTAHDTLAQHTDSDAIVDHFATNADPTPKKIHTQWIMNQYKKGNIRQEDHPRIRAALENLSNPAVKRAIKDAGHPTDLNQHTLSSLEDAIEPHIGKLSGNQQQKQIKSEGADLIHDDKQSGVTVHHIKTEQAACSYGAGTKWCTAGEKNNMFNQYNKDGPIYVIHHHNKQTGETTKYQFHNASNQFMDAQDRPVRRLPSEVQQSLAKSEHPEIASALVLHGDSKHVTPQHIDAAMNHPVASVVTNALKRKDIAFQSRHIDMAIKHPSMFVQETALSHQSKLLTPHHIDTALQDPDGFVARAVFVHLQPKHLESRHILAALKHPEGSVGFVAMLKARERPEIVRPHIDVALQHPDPRVRKIAPEILSNKNNIKTKEGIRSRYNRTNKKV